MGNFFASAIAVIVVLLLVGLIARIAYWLTRKILVNVIHKLVEKSKTHWDDFLLKRKVFAALAHLSSAFIFYFVYDFSGIEDLTKVLYGAVQVYFIIIAVMSFSGVINAAMDIYNTTPYAEKPINKGICAINIDPGLFYSRNIYYWSIGRRTAHEISYWAGRHCCYPVIGF